MFKVGRREKEKGPLNSLVQKGLPVGQPKQEETGQGDPWRRKGRGSVIAARG